MRFAAWTSGLFLLLILVTGGWFLSYILTPSAADTETVIYIPKGASVRGINTILADHGLIGKDIRFLVLARLSGTAGRLRAGEYLVPAHLKPLEILRLLEKGEVIRHKVTIPEGLTISQIAAIFAGDNWVDSRRFQQLANDRDFIRSLGFDQSTLEGYLYPDTYSLARGEVTEESLLTMMAIHFQQVWEELTRNSAPDLLRHQVVILASIVEKETGAPEERPVIARVFLNRLEKNMRLQSDPTVIYGLKNFSGNLTRNDLATDTPYNTYLRRGLPPTPICNPGKASLAAVLHPADAPYFYFVSKNDGTHYFSTTLREHNRAVRRYQKRKSKTAAEKQAQN